MASIWSPCVELPMQRLSLGIETKNDLCTDLRRRRSITVFTFIYYGGANVYRCKTQSITAGSNCESEFIAAYSLCKLIFYVRHILKLSCFNQTESTPGYNDNLSALEMINDNNTSVEQIRHMGIRLFSLQDLRETGNIKLFHIRTTFNTSDVPTKGLGWVLHSRHCRRYMGHFG